MRVAVVTTHPIQYQVPWLRLLSARADIELQVFFAMIPDAVEQGREFGVAFAWDLPLLDGYSYKLLDNRAKTSSLTDFAGCDTPGIGEELRAGRYEAVVVNGWGTKMALQTLWACRRLGIPCIVRGEANGLRPRAAWKRGLHALLLKQYAAFLAIGKNNRDYYLRLGVPDARIFDSPYCVDNAHFAAAADEWRRAPGVPALRDRFGLERDLPTYVFSGKFVEKKRPQDIIAASRMLFEQGFRDFQVLMVGNGPMAADLRASAQGLPLRFAGFLNQSEITAAYAAGDALILPSDSGETWGLVVNEAMACGLPALVSDQVGSARNLVDNGVTGSVFSCGDVSGLAGLIREYARDVSALHAMGFAARARVHSNYNFERVVDGAMAALGFIARKRP